MSLRDLFDPDRKDDALAERGGRIVGHAYRDTTVSDDTFFPRQIRRCTFENVSFREYRINHPWWRESTFHSCDFTKADLAGLGEWANTFEDCVFEHANLDLGGIGFYGSVYRRCRFVRTRFKKAVFGRPEFDSCEFINCMLDGADLNAASFERCRFTGRLREVWFRTGFESRDSERQQGRPRPNRMLEVDFSDAVLEDCMFTGGVALDTIILPSDGRHLLYDRMQERAHSVLKSSRNWPEPHRKAGEFYFELIRLYPQQQWGIVNLDDLAEMFEERAPLILEALGEPVTR